MVVWLIGLSGAGKSTLARAVCDLARRRLDNLVLLDGDQVREVFGGDLGHGLADRRRNAERICRLCRLLDQQGIHVVCAILSMFEESRQWNRGHYSDYYEVFIDTPLELLQARDPKGLYRLAREQGLTDVPGLDLPFPRPQSPDLVIDNRQGLEALLSHAPAIAARLTGGGPP